MKSRKIIVIISILFVLVFSMQRGLKEPIENLLIISGIGLDINVKESGNVEYKLSIPAYTFEENKISSKVYTASASTIPETREIRQEKIDKRYITSFEKVYIISEDYARYGIRNLLDILQKNSWVNDEGYVVVCKGNAEEIVKLNVKGYPSSADFIDSMISASKSYNYYPKTFALINAFKFVDAEGINITLPYIEINNGQIEMTGLAFFQNDKMIASFNATESKILNILRGSKTSGIFEIKEPSDKYLSYESSAKTKVVCSKNDEKYKFTINIDFKGDIISNELYSSTLEDPKQTKDIEKKLEEVIKADCMDFITKMQNDYKVDLLNLGYYGAAKFGRHKEPDWNQAVTNADIEVNIKVKVDKYGRGDF